MNNIPEAPGPQEVDRYNASLPSSADAPVSTGRTSERRSEGMRNIISTVLILLLAPFIALTLTSYVFQSYQVDGPSMMPTLQNNDRLIVLKAPRTWARLTGHPYIPNRGDIIIFIENGLGDFQQGQPKQLVKRVIGLPGDHVLIKDNLVTIYNAQHPHGFQPDTTLFYSKAIATTPGNVDIVVPPNQVFVCGDNRVNSLDSRVFGTVPANEIVGKLILRVFPLSTAQKF